VQNEDDHHSFLDMLGRDILRVGGRDDDTDRASPKVLLWSGKVQHAEAVFNDLYTFDMAADRWRAIYRLSMEDGAKENYPAPR
jgi:hypothetical protein